MPLRNTKYLYAKISTTTINKLGVLKTNLENYGNCILYKVNGNTLYIRLNRNQNIIKKEVMTKTVF